MEKRKGRKREGKKEEWAFWVVPPQVQNAEEKEREKFHSNRPRVHRSKRGRKKNAKKADSVNGEQCTQDIPTGTTTPEVRQKSNARKEGKKNLPKKREPFSFLWTGEKGRKFAWGRVREREGKRKICPIPNRPSREKRGEEL